MTIEVFTVPAGQEAAPTRNVSNDIRLAAPSDIFLGVATPGVAYYEKSGADLKVTLLDGKTVVIRDFFVIGESGEYSRLHDGGREAPIEVTGLVAPEPMVPESQLRVEAVTPATPVEEPQAATAAEPAAVAPVSEAAEVAEQGSAGSINPTFGGFQTDRVFFGAALLPVVATMFASDNNRDDPAPVRARLDVEHRPAEEPAGDAPAQVQPPAVADGAAEADHPPAGTDAAALADYLAGLFPADDAALAQLNDAGGDEAPVALLGQDPATPFDDALIGGVDLFAALFDHTIYHPIEG